MLSYLITNVNGGILSDLAVQVVLDQRHVCFTARIRQALERGCACDDFHLDTVLLPPDGNTVESPCLHLLMQTLRVDTDEPRSLLRGKLVGKI